MGEEEENDYDYSILPIVTETDKQKIQAQFKKFNEELQNVLSDNDYPIVKDEIDILKYLIENDSEKSFQQKKNVLKKLQKLHDAGKITATELDNIEENLEKTIGLMDKQRENERKESASSGFLPENVKEILEEPSNTQNLNLKQILSSILSSDDYKAINKELEALKSLPPGDLIEFNQQKKKILGTLKDLSDNGKLTGDEYEKILEKVEEDILLTKKKMEDKALLNQNNKLNQELQSMLANDDFTKVSNEIEVLQLLLDNNSDKSTEQEKNVYKSLENLHETGKLTDSEYESLKESVQSTISKKKQITSQIDRKKDAIVGSYTLDSKLDHELKSILSDNEYGVICNDIQELVSMTEDSEEFNS